MGTSWCSRKGGILEEGGWPRKEEGGVGPPLPTMNTISILLLLSREILTLLYYQRHFCHYFQLIHRNIFLKIYYSSSAFIVLLDLMFMWEKICDATFLAYKILNPFVNGIIFFKAK